MRNVVSLTNVDGHDLIGLVVEAPAEGDDVGVHPVFDLVRVDQVVQLGVLHPPQRLAQPNTNLEEYD